MEGITKTGKYYVGIYDPVKGGDCKTEGVKTLY